METTGILKQLLDALPLVYQVRMPTPGPYSQLPPSNTEPGKYLTASNFTLFCIYTKIEQFYIYRDL